jgi:adenylosuccinate lyase
MNEYVNAFSARYGSKEMSRLFSPQKRGELFRKLWLALAKTQKKLGLSISDAQIKEMETNISNIDFARVEHFEKTVRHDVMAHIHAFGELCPKAAPIIHLGATSCYVTDNADLILLREGLQLLLQKLLPILKQLGDLAETHAANPCLSYTHFQPAQPTTIGKRLCLWLQDFYLDAQEWLRLIREIPFLGAKGATGTQASFLTLFDGDHKKVLELEHDLAKFFGFSKTLPISGQTYTRKLDISILNALQSFAASAHKCATDLRLLAHEGEFCEPFSEKQVGSSAMPYKRNPIYSERICGLARYTISLSQNAAYTAATQWLERSLDDSSNRRLVIPESFLSVDAILSLLSHILSKPQIDPKIAYSNFERHLDHLSMENILMEAVKRGESRQEAHEKLRQKAMKKQSAGTTDPKTLLGRAKEQVFDFLNDEIKPFLKKHPPGKITAGVEL